MFRRLLHNNPSLKVRRQYLRNHATIPEKMLWEKIRNNQLGIKFRRQYSFGSYILDFYCPQKQLGIEIDGKIHIAKQDMDTYRTRTLEKYDITIIRFTNDEVENKLDLVIRAIKSYL
jgi:very-short-patch-repair endonuclease